ncbi:MAG TPA: citrate/2-methylcitrate synthase [Spirochaetota bacterium]|jgi:citrate synthase|nr:citrate/2-methylcitrate synthase [Spirochaetota bacterium]HPW51332.1 citrate/2-methylcitrate synthase [Spirochaetota bacterium]HPY03740.1 citrate/2-methylcitrate synthase [Spirochaetota bacterium]HQA52767.1 citrate/2-methylcitrate synthase [Spirochaetota bacterium]
MKRIEEWANKLIASKIDPDLYSRYNVKRGLRNSDGSGVLVGLTGVGDVHGYIVDEGEASPVEGRLRYRGIDVKDLTVGFQNEKRFGFEETAFLLMFGYLPEKDELKDFSDSLAKNRELPEGFKENMIFRAPSKDIMNKIARSVLTLYSYDDNPEDRSIKNVLRQCIELIARFPVLAAYGFQAKQHYFEGSSLYIHNQQENLSTAENFLSIVRPNKEYSRTEAEILDLALVLHAEHGGGNNSTFTVHVVASTDTDTYSSIGAAVGSLKGPKHGGANHSVSMMMQDIMSNVKEVSNESALKEYIRKIFRKEAFDRTGLIYGMGHAVYSLSDPRAILLKAKAKELAKEKGREEEFSLYEEVERLGKTVFEEEKGSKVICANIDFYSGFVYDMLGIHPDLHTPIFAMARIAGWASHLIEEIVSGGRIMRPAYKYVLPPQKYIPLNER